MKIAIGSDHAGVKLKKAIIDSFKNIRFEDLGAHTDESVDYPDFISTVGFRVRDGDADLGIVICGTGIGASIVANKIKGIRAALCANEFSAEMSRRHNDANVLALGARVTGDELALAIVRKWIETPFEGGRHQRRIDKIHALERN